MHSAQYLIDKDLENSKLTHIIDSCQGSDIGYPSDIQLCTLEIKPCGLKFYNSRCLFLEL